MNITLCSANVSLEADLSIPPGARGLVIFAHGSGSSRHSPRNRDVARRLNSAALATLLLDLLTAPEQHHDAQAGAFRFDIPLLAGRLAGAAAWAARQRDLAELSMGLFGASTGAAAAIVAAAQTPERFDAIVCRGGRPDLAGEALGQLAAPTLLIVGSLDEQVLVLNHQAAARMTGRREIRIVEGAGHLFEEPGTLELVSRMAADWFIEHLRLGRADSSRR